MYISHPSYFGATIGRVCNRITHGHFFLNNRDYNLPVNNPPNHLHGGNVGFDKCWWVGEVLREEPPTVAMKYTSRAGEEGYPGELVVMVTFTLEGHEVVVDYSARLTEANDRALQTIVNLTSHPFFNLSGYTGNDKSVLDHTVHIPHPIGFLDMTENQLPTGKVVPIKNLGQSADALHKALDFTTAKSLGQDLLHVRAFRGYDHFYLLRQIRSNVTPPAVTRSVSPVALSPPSSSAPTPSNLPSSPVLPRTFPNPSAVSPTPHPLQSSAPPPQTQLTQTAATVTCHSSGIQLQVRTDAAGLQLYSGNWLDSSSLPPKTAHRSDASSSEKDDPEGYIRYGAVCLEPSAPVDAINHPAWREEVVLSHDQEWRQTVVYSFGIS
ncbi:galactose mutarotase-like domain-containing protein [Phlyctochytrium arcticum]|nr:galactose mutarotase-like domain-containing protein [Phlyctochytrium arcticum]